MKSKSPTSENELTRVPETKILKKKKKNAMPKISRFYGYENFVGATKSEKCNAVKKWMERTLNRR